MYSGRSTTRWANDSTDATLTVNYFNEDDDRMRASNQSCLRDPEGIIGCLPTALADDTTNSAATAAGFLLQHVVEPITGLTFPDDDFINSPQSSDPREQWMDFTPRYEVDDTIVAFEVNHTFGDLTVTSLTGYHNSNLDARMIMTSTWRRSCGQWRSLCSAGPMALSRLIDCTMLIALRPSRSSGVKNCAWPPVMTVTGILWWADSTSPTRVPVNITSIPQR